LARIRTIKPEFPHSQSMGRVSRDARLLFVNLWTVSDDEGRARGASRLLASLLYPYDDDAPALIDDWLAELERENCVVRYTVDGTDYVQITNWLDHQKIDKPTKSRLPAFDEGSRTFAKPREGSSADLGPSTLDQDPGPIRAVANATRPDLEKHFDEFWKVYPKRGDAANPKKPALEKFSRLLRGGTDPTEIIASARRYAEIERRAGRVGTDKIAQAITWLNQHRWQDYSAQAPPPDDEPVWKKPPREFLERQANGATHKSALRSDTGLGEIGPGHREELSLSSGGVLPAEVRGAEWNAPNDPQGNA
jgi:hypothetical protein